MRMPALILIVAAAALQVFLGSAQGVENLSRQKQIEASARRVKELQQERIAALEEAVKSFAVLFSNGRAGYDEVIDAKLLLLEAELDVAEKQSDRIALYQKMVDVLKSYEQWGDVQKQNAQGTDGATLKIKARRLEAEIHLEQAKAKEAKESK